MSLFPKVVISIKSNNLYKTSLYVINWYFDTTNVTNSNDCTAKITHIYWLNMLVISEHNKFYILDTTIFWSSSAEREIRSTEFTCYQRSIYNFACNSSTIPDDSYDWFKHSCAKFRIVLYYTQGLNIKKLQK